MAMGIERYGWLLLYVHAARCSNRMIGTTIAAVLLSFVVLCLLLLLLLLLHLHSMFLWSIRWWFLEFVAFFHGAMMSLAFPAFNASISL